MASPARDNPHDPPHDQPIEDASRAAFEHDDFQPDQIGPYRIIRRIASGGMGTVYEARQASPDRAVAVKVLSAGIGSTGTQQRFADEAQTLARLHHPAIAQIYQAGVCAMPAGQLAWFAMELVVGARTLTDAARSDGLTVRQRLELVAGICDAVAHGHRMGIIHRDLKPANILVDREGHPKVIDFGVARLIDRPDDELRTAQGQLVGTIAYMSPEQIAGDPDEVDIRTDVYALGVVLYELLTGQRPHDLSRAGIVEAARIIHDEPITHPAALTGDRSMRGDLGWIVMAALARDRDDRYASAHELARDLRRYLASEPILARPPSLGRQLRTLARRHRLIVSASAGALVVLIASLVVIARLYLDTDAARRDAIDNAAAADRRLALARSSMDLVLFDLIDRLEGVAGTRTIRLDLLESLAESTRQLAREDPKRLGRSAWVDRLKLGRTALGLGEHALAAQATADGTTLVRAAMAREPNNTTLRADLVNAARQLSEIAEQVGQMDQAIAAAREGIAQCDWLLTRDRDDRFALARKASLLRQLGDLRAARSEYDQAEGLFEESLAISRQLAAREPTDDDHASAIARTLRRLGSLAADRGELDAAIGHAERAIEIRRTLAAAAPADIRRTNNLASAQLGLADTLARADQTQRAEALAREAAGLLDRARALEPDTPMYRWNSAQACGLIADLAGRRGALDDQRSWRSRQIDHLGALATRPASTPEELTELARVLLDATPRDLRDPARAVAAASAAVGAESADPAGLALLARACAAAGDHDRAARVLARAVDQLAAGDDRRDAYRQLLERYRAGARQPGDR